MEVPKRVFVSGCFDLLHSGHIAFLKEAAEFGDLYVSLGSDSTIFDLKGRTPINNEEERLFMIRSISFVKEAFIAKGSGILDFLEEFKTIMPHIFVVNEDGNIAEKRELCKNHDSEYVVLERKPHASFPQRSTTSLRALNHIPYRIDLAGGWLDQPFVSKTYPGPVITISIEPTIDFNERSGMASSTRRSAIDLWETKIPIGDYEKLAKILFCFDNPPGTEEVSGAQDSVGIVFPGLSKSNYSGKYWPDSIDSSQDENTLQFIENALYLIPLSPRHTEYKVLDRINISKNRVEAFSRATEDCWQSILKRDLQEFGYYMKQSFIHQTTMFPNMVNDSIRKLIRQYEDAAIGWKLSGAGGGGYLILASDNHIDNAISISIRREYL